MAPFSCDFLYSKYDSRWSSFGKLFLTIKITKFAYFLHKNASKIFLPITEKSHLPLGISGSTTELIEESISPLYSLVIFEIRHPKHCCIGNILLESSFVRKPNSHSGLKINVIGN